MARSASSLRTSGRLGGRLNPASPGIPDWDGQLVDESLDELVYHGGAATQSTVLELCWRRETLALLVKLMDVVASVLNTGIRILIDEEPTLFESAYSLMNTLATCAEVLGSKLAFDTPDGRTYRFRLTMVAEPPQPNEIVAIVFREGAGTTGESDIDTVLDTVLRSQFTLLIYMSPSPRWRPVTAVYLENLVQGMVRDALRMIGEEWRLKYLGRVPHELVLYASRGELEAAARSWTPPPPPNAAFLKKRPRRLDELVFPEGFKRLVRIVATAVRRSGGGTLLLAGLPGSGRRTLAKALADELGLPAYSISVANVLGWRLGESEQKLRAFFTGLRHRGGLAVFESVDVMFRRSGNESVQQNLRSILFQELARDDNRFVIVFSASEDAPGEVFDSPLLGQVKLIVPVPLYEERVRLARMFLREILGEQLYRRLVETVGQRLGLSGESAEEAALRTYADSFAEVSAGMTPGELYRTMQLLLAPVPKALEEGRVPQVPDTSLLTRRNYAARIAKLRTLERRARNLGLGDVAEKLGEAQREVEELAQRYGVTPET